MAVLVCRNNGTRLFGKPLQLIDIENRISILDYIINNLRQLPAINKIVLGIAEGIENQVFKQIADRNGIDYVVGSEELVSERYLLAAEQSRANHIFRVTTECPFLWSEGLDLAYSKHIDQKFDATFIWNIIDGTEFEIYSTETVAKINALASNAEKEHLSLFVRNNPSKFKVNRITPPKKFIREDIRLTVDYPEDLVFCRNIYNLLKKRGLANSLSNVLSVIDDNPSWKTMVQPFLEKGHTMMRHWSE